MARYSGSYDPIGKALHYVAFGVPFVQRMLAELEDDLFSRQIAAVQPAGEVFIAGLPRAGTTLLLELLYKTGAFASFTYRDMPFVLSPTLWSRLTRAFARAARAAPRAHDDGMSISIDNPEAFEEVIWLTYLGSAIVGERSIEPVTADSLSPGFACDMRAAIRRLLAHRAELEAGRRYLSKNNANVSRLDSLAQVFPESAVLVAFRHPAAQVASLLRQHRRFSEMHEQDVFTQRYMRWIGHYEFGANLRPINYRGWFYSGGPHDFSQPEFWLRYWTETYRHALEHRRGNVFFVDFDGLLEGGANYLASIADAVNLDADSASALTAQAPSLRAPGSRPMLPREFRLASWEQAWGVYGRLREVALQPRVPVTRARAASAATNSSRLCSTNRQLIR